LDIFDLPEDNEGELQIESGTVGTINNYNFQITATDTSGITSDYGLTLYSIPNPDMTNFDISGDNNLHTSTTTSQNSSYQAINMIPYQAIPG
jgi:hypothetical protein